MKSLDPLRAKETFIRKNLDHTMVSAIKASSVTLYIWQQEPEENTVNLQISCFGVRVSVMFHFMFVHYTFNSVWVAEWPPFRK